MQEKYGALRVADVGIREATIIGQGIGWRYRFKTYSGNSIP
jgi:pyruvate/2-oxoglutarate/acetoin dehydrogenase E1 component